MISPETQTQSVSRTSSWRILWQIVIAELSAVVVIYVAMVIKMIFAMPETGMEAWTPSGSMVTAEAAIAMIWGLR
jgi:hypothetical protein